VDSLKELKIRLKEELFIEESEDEKEQDAKDKQRAFTYRKTDRGTKGKAVSIEYEVDYKDLKTQLDKSVPNINWTIPKVKETFKIIRKFVGFEDPQKNKSE
jgi:hypothetical protein